MQSAVRTHSDSGFSESELRLRQTSLLLQTHLMRLHSLSQLLVIFLSLPDSLLTVQLHLFKVSLLREKCSKMLNYIQYTTNHYIKVVWIQYLWSESEAKNIFGNVSGYETQIQNVLLICSYKRLLHNNILHISYLKFNSSA